MEPALPLLFLSSIAGVAQQEGEAERVAGWRADLDRLVSVASEMHAGPSHPAQSEAFAQAADALSQRIPELADRRVAVEFQRLLALLGDGHSLVYPAPAERASFDMLPVDLYLFADGLFVVDGLGPSRELVGSRVDRIGARTTKELLHEMEPFVSRDNEMGLKAFAGVYLILPAFLEAMGAADGPERVTLTLNVRGDAREVTLKAGPARRVRKRLPSAPSAPGPSPLYLQDTERVFLTHSLASHAALYFQLNQVADSPDTTLAALAAQLRATLTSTGARNLIVDVRHNSGGNNLLLQPLLDAIAGFAEGSHERRVFVITGRATFSAAQNFITRLERRLPRVVFAGEPSMSSPNFTGEDNPLQLPFSGLMVGISNRYWQDSAPDDVRPWIEPHLPAVLTSEDWLANRDPALDAVLRAISAR